MIVLKGKELHRTSKSENDLLTRTKLKTIGQSS